MSAWSSSLYGNDTTCDIRDTYIGFLEEQFSNQEAYEKTLDKCHEYLQYEEDEALFWFALAETQWKVGRLMPEVKNKALEWINKNGGMTLWEYSKTGGSGWKKTLEKLRTKLETEQPKEKKIRKPIIHNKNLWNVGDVYAYQFHTEESKQYETYGKYMLIQKIGEGRWPGGETLMRAHILNKLFDDLPTIESIEGIRPLPLDFPGEERAIPELCMNRLLYFWKKKEYPESCLIYIGNAPAPTNTVINRYQSTMLDWSRIEKWSKFFQAWQGVEYETVGNGIFRYIPQK